MALLSQFEENSPFQRTDDRLYVRLAMRWLNHLQPVACSLGLRGLYLTILDGLKKKHVLLYELLKIGNVRRKPEQVLADPQHVLDQR